VPRARLCKRQQHPTRRPVTGPGAVAFTHPLLLLPLFPCTPPPPLRNMSTVRVHQHEHTHPFIYAASTLNTATLSAPPTSSLKLCVLRKRKRHTKHLNAPAKHTSPPKRRPCRRARTHSPARSATLRGCWVFWASGGVGKGSRTTRTRRARRCFGVLALRRRALLLLVHPRRRRTIVSRCAGRRASLPRVW
jgi:hypothetical protein